MISIALLCAGIVLASAPDATSISSTCETLYLLNVLPYPDNRTFAGWDRAFELIPAGHLATRHINNDSNVLQGYRLEVIDVESEACGISFVNEALLNYYKAT